MTREYLVVFEKGEHNWSAFAPDVLGCGGMGDTLDETRTDVQQVLEIYLKETAEMGQPVPVATTTSVDFSEFDPEHEAQQYVVEWLPITLPEATPIMPPYGLKGVA